MTRFFTLLLILISIFSFSFGQRYYSKEIPKSYGLIFGYQGFHSNMIELGIAKGLKGAFMTTMIGKSNKLLVKKPYANIYCSYHIDPSKNIHGAIIGFTGVVGIIYGLDFNYYYSENDFWGIRPSVGVSIFGIETIYRYNFRLGGIKTLGISGHQFSLRYYLPIFVDTENGFKFGKRYRLD